jgi:hypothetical protein
LSSYDLAIVFSSVITALGGVAWVYIAMMSYRGQMNAEVFLRCNERYDEIMWKFPEDAWQARFKMSTELPPQSIKLTLCALSYLNLSSEEYYLYRSKYIHKKIWNIWECELVRSLRGPLMRREWQILKHEFMNSYPEFSKWVDEVQSAATAKKPTPLGK